MKASWTGKVEFGFVSFDSKLAPVIESKEKISFNQLHKTKIVKDEKGNRKEMDCHSKVYYKTFCSSCETEIIDKKSELVKGWEKSKGNWVILTQDEVDSCKKENNEKIKIIQFIKDSEIPEVYYESSYFLFPSDEDNDTFGLFHSILKESNRMALGKVVMRATDHFFAIKPLDGILIAYDLHFPNEIRNVKDVGKFKFSEFDDETKELCKNLIDKMTKPFNPELIKDEYTEGLKEIIKAKIEGKEIKPIEKKVEKKVLSLKDALKESLEEEIYEKVA